MLKRLLLACFLLLPCAALAANTSGLPLPRFAALKPDEVNARTGPGTRYPISWVYRRSGMPVEIVEEYDLWRKIHDADGTTGWVHKSMLDGKRNVMVTGKEAHIVRIDPEDKAKPMLKVEPQVIARVIECDKSWCRIQVQGRKGWLEKKYLWGVYDKEVFD